MKNTLSSSSLSQLGIVLQQADAMVVQLRSKQIYTPLSWPLFCQIIVYLLYFQRKPDKLHQRFVLQLKGESQVMNAYLLGGIIAVLLLAVIVLANVVSKIRRAQWRKALEQILERYHQAGIALVRYVMLNRQCSEEVAYQRIATFVKKRVPLDDR